MKNGHGIMYEELLQVKVPQSEAVSQRLGMCARVLVGRINAHGLD